jgi:hypothetical protein
MDAGLGIDSLPPLVMTLHGVPAVAEPEDRHDRCLGKAEARLTLRRAALPKRPELANPTAAECGAASSRAKDDAGCG